MGNPTTTPSQDDLMSRLSAVSATPAQSGTPSGDDLLSRINIVAGTTPVKMIDAKGNVSSVPEYQLSSARAKGLMPTADNSGAQKMVTPDGRVTFAMPSEVERFKSSGHTAINANGTFRVEPMDGEDNMDAMARAVKVMKALTPQEQKQAMDNEIHPFDPRPVSSGGSGLKGAGRLAIHGVVAPIVAGTAGTAALAGGAEVLNGVAAGASALGETEAGQLFSSSPRLYAEYLLRQGIKGVGQYALEHKLGTAIVLDQLAKVLGIQKSTVMHKLISAGAGARTE